MRLTAQVIQPLKIKRRNLKGDAKQKEGTIPLFTSLIQRAECSVLYILIQGEICSVLLSSLETKR